MILYTDPTTDPRLTIEAIGFVSMDHAPVGPPGGLYDPLTNDWILEPYETLMGESYSVVSANGTVSFL